LQEVILRQPDNRFEPREDPLAAELIKQAAAQIKKIPPAHEPTLAPISELTIDADEFFAGNQMNILDNDVYYDDNTPPENYAAPAKEETLYHEPVVYPKSVVRMSGKIIGEYYHDGNIVTKEERHYIYNSRFMAERLTAGLTAIKSRFSQEIHAELIKIVEDAASRVRDNRRFHFEVSTNEIMNDKNLKQLSSDLRRRTWDDAEWFASRLSAKIEMLGINYEAMLQEQMERCAEIG
jgi:primosomal protein N''